MFKKQLKNILYQRRMTASELSRRTGVPKQTLSDWLAGTHPRNMEFVRRVAEELDVAIDELFFDKEAKARARKKMDDSETFLETRRSDEQIEKAFYNFVFKNIDVKLFRVVDLKTGCPLALSDTWDTILGWRLEDLREVNWLQLIHPEDRERVQSTVERNLKSAAPVSVCDYRLRRRDGQYVRIHTKFSAEREMQVLLSISALVESGRDIGDASDDASMKGVEIQPDLA